MAKAYQGDAEQFIEEQKKAFKELEKERKKAGKKPFHYDPYGPGIMPQEKYDILRYPDDPDYKPKPEPENPLSKDFLAGVSPDISDGNRTYPVDYLVMHHSVGPDFVNTSDMEVADWYDSVGRNRGYAGVARSYHRHPYRDKETFAQAHIGARYFTSDGNKYGYRLTPLMTNIWNNVAWHAGNWPINQRSIGIENCGNFLSKKLTDKALMCVADFIRPQDQKIGGKLQVVCHKMVSLSGTACAGLICEQCQQLIDMINEPKKWNDKLWPPPPPPPSPTPTLPEWQLNLKPIPDKAKKLEKAVNLVNIETGVAQSSFAVGTEITVHYETTHRGIKFYMTKFSAEKKIPNGFIAAEFDYVKPPDPKPTPPPPPEPEPVDPCEELKKELKDVKTKLEQAIEDRDDYKKKYEELKEGKGIIFISDLIRAITDWLSNLKKG